MPSFGLCPYLAQVGLSVLLGATFIGGCSDSRPGEPVPETFVAITFNTGTTEGMDHDGEPDDGYTSAHALISDEWYGDGLSWLPAVAAAREFLAEVDPDMVVFQEIFYAEECLGIPLDDHQDFFCQNWQPGQATVANHILGPDYQVACHPGKPDKCAAVHRRFGSFVGCDSDFCLEGLAGYRVEDCGRGARVARGLIDLTSGGSLTLINYHGSSGLTAEEQNCRVQQVDQVFVDLGDGQPGIQGPRNLIMGDLNTDPGRMDSFDPSAVRWNDFVGPGKPFHFLTAVGEEAPPTYATLFNIDHVIGDSISGSCWAAGVSPGHPDVIQAIYFDHKPQVCQLQFEPLD